MAQLADACVTIHPYFKVSDGNIGAFRALCERFVSRTSNEPKCIYYGFSFNGNEVHCREGYQDADGLLVHLDNVATLLEEALKLAEITRLEIHGREDELARIRGPVSNLSPTYFTLEYGFRRS
jgi:hypothetical protein